MLKTALFDCAINEKCCSVDGERGIWPIFSSPPRGIWQLKSPHPREFAIQGKQKCPGVSPGVGGGGGRWAQLELTDALIEQISFREVVAAYFPSRAEKESCPVWGAYFRNFAVCISSFNN